MAAAATRKRRVRSPGWTPVFSAMKPVAEGKFGAAQWSDMGGPTNPKNIWSPEYIFLKQSIDKGADPEIVSDSLHDWLFSRGIPDSKVTDLLQLPPEQALQEFVRLLKAGLEADRLPPDALATLRRALNHIAGKHIAQKQSELDAAQADLNRMKSDFSEDVRSVVNFLLEREGACAMCEREFGVHNPNASHGYCKRHSLQMYQSLKQTPQIAAKIEQIKAMPDDNFVPDLANVAPEQRGRAFDFQSKQFAR
jgi:hypothetical protein